VRKYNRERKERKKIPGEKGGRKRKREGESSGERER
jgi:hypothetical protein